MKIVIEAGFVRNPWSLES